jgi:3-methyl-2-oxobutanoate hydroxymethyltransferase
VTETIMARMQIPVIGIGAGPATDGQVLVFHDLLGIYGGHAPRFTKRFAEVRRSMVEGMQAYADEVRSGRFPAAEHTYSVDPEELAQFKEIVAPSKPWDAADFMS